jgi:hypothetical protein
MPLTPFDLARQQQKVTDAEAAMLEQEIDAGLQKTNQTVHDGPEVWVSVSCCPQAAAETRLIARYKEAGWRDLRFEDHQYNGASAVLTWPLPSEILKHLDRHDADWTRMTTPATRPETVTVPIPSEDQVVDRWAPKPTPPRIV